MKFPALFLAAVCLVSGGFAIAQDSGGTGAAEDVSVKDSGAEAMIGSYVGAFGKRKIMIRLDRVIGKTVTGYSIVAGNERAFAGSWSQLGPDYAIIAKEPGDHEHDGVFRMTFLDGSKTLIGEWQANDSKIETRKFKLPARVFKYDAKLGSYPQSSTRALKEADVENMRPAELRIMRNEIYARHGYSFKLADMREHFDALEWYMPASVDIQSKLTATEEKNAALIKRYEKYGEEYYDGFGR